MIPFAPVRSGPSWPSNNSVLTGCTQGSHGRSGPVVCVGTCCFGRFNWQGIRLCVHEQVSPPQKRARVHAFLRPPTFAPRQCVHVLRLGSGMVAKGVAALSMLWIDRAHGVLGCVSVKGLNIKCRGGEPWARDPLHLCKQQADFKIRGHGSSRSRVVESATRKPATEGLQRGCFTNKQRQKTGEKSSKQAGLWNDVVDYLGYEELRNQKRPAICHGVSRVCGRNYLVPPGSLDRALQSIRLGTSFLGRPSIGRVI